MGYTIHTTSCIAQSCPWSCSPPWLTSDATEGEIVHFMESLCRALGNILPDLETMCIDLMEAQLPAIIDGLVEENLNPMEVCVNIAACYPPPPTTTSLPPTTQARSRRLL